MTLDQWDIRFRIDSRSAVPPYQQLTQQVRHALRLGWLRVGDQLPTVRGVVADLAVNPNTVLKAYRELELEGLVAGRPGQGTFVVKTLADEAAVKSHASLRKALVRWLSAASRAGLDEESVVALFETTLYAARSEEVV